MTEQNPSCGLNEHPTIGPRRRFAFGRRLVSVLADIAMPPVCFGCQVPLVDHHALCAACWADIDFIRAPLCDLTGVPMSYSVGEPMISAAAAADPPPYDRARAVGLYSGTLKSLLHDFKFRDRQELRRLFVRWLCEAGAPFWQDADLVIPVPLHTSRLLKRRFNQAAVLGREISRVNGVPFAPLVLRRTRATPQQIGLTRQQRRDNVRGAFAVPEHLAIKLYQAKVVLIDDVITTGATIAACTKALRQAGAARVDVLALALTNDGVDST